MSNKLQQKSPPKMSEPAAYRIVEFRAESMNDEQRSVEVTLATEHGVDVYDWQRGVIKEYLVMDGGKLPQQVPLVDSHNHGSVRNILGSIRNLRVDGGKLKGTAYFGAKPAAAEAYADMKDGHLTDISVGFFRTKERYIEADKSESVGARTIKGPARIVTRWQPFEGSAVTVGADRHSTFGSVPALRCYLDPESMREEQMETTYREMLIGLGMPSELNDEQATAWGKENLAKKEERAAIVPPVAPAVEPVKSQPDTATLESSQRAERARVQSIRKNVRLAGLPETFADSLIDDGTESGVAAERILQEKIKVNETSITSGTTIKGTGSRADSFRKIAFDAVSARLTGGKWDRPAGCEDFRHMRLLELATRCVAEQDSSIDVRGMSKREIVTRALMPTFSTRASDGQAFHTTGSFANLLLDATHKTLLMGFENTPSTFQVWTRNAGTVDDFKDIHRARLGEVGNLPMVPENGDYKDMSLSDGKESYRVEKHGGIVSLTWETIMNDDLNAFSRMVQMQGSAAKRTINKSVYDLLFSNPVLSDSVALFHASSHGGNLDTLDLSVTNLNAGYTCMMTQTGINSDVILGLTPSFLLVSASDSATAEQILGSFADPAVGGSAAGNSNSLNIYGPSGRRKLTLVVEPLIDGNDADSYYLAADPNTCDTFEVTYLAGEETPVFEQETAFIQDAVKYKVRQTWGVGAIDYRGLYKSAGNG